METIINTNKEELIAHLKNKIKIFKTQNVRLATDNEKLKTKTIKLQKNINKLKSENFYIENIIKKNQIRSTDNQERIINFIINEVAVYSGYPFEAIKTMKNQRHELVFARQIGHYLAQIYNKLTLSAISYHIGRKNHATVLYSEKTIINRLSYDKKLHVIIEGMKERIEDFIKEISININKDIQVIIHRPTNPIRLKVHGHYCKTIN